MVKTVWLFYYIHRQSSEISYDINIISTYEIRLEELLKNIRKLCFILHETGI